MLVAIKDVAEASSQLSDLVRQVEAGNEIVLTRNGCCVARLIPAVLTQSQAQRRIFLEQFQHSVFQKAMPGPDAARSQDFLYGEDGLPA